MKEYYKRKEIQFSIYEVEEKENDLKAITFFDSIEEVAEYLEINKTMAYKVVKGLRKVFIDVPIKVYDNIINQWIDTTERKEIKIIKDIF